MLLRDSPNKGDTTWSAVAEWAMEGKGKDASGYRMEFLSLIEKARGGFEMMNRSRLSAQAY